MVYGAAYLLPIAQAGTSAIFLPFDHDDNNPVAAYIHDRVRLISSMLQIDGLQSVVHTPAQAQASFRRIRARTCTGSSRFFRTHLAARRELNRMIPWLDESPKDAESVESRGRFPPWVPFCCSEQATYSVALRT
jgi:hypothetical protein